MLFAATINPISPSVSVCSAFGLAKRKVTWTCLISMSASNACSGFVIARPVVRGQACLLRRHACAVDVGVVCIGAEAEGATGVAL